MAVIRIVVNDPFGLVFIEGTVPDKIAKIKNTNKREKPRDEECVKMVQRVLGDNWTCFDGRGNGDNDEYIFTSDEGMFDKYGLPN